MVETVAAAPASETAPMGVVEQVRTALKDKNRLATVIGFLIGGFPPVASFFVAHVAPSGIPPWMLYASYGLVLGGLIFSAKTVWQWCRLAFLCPYKATGFVILAEGVMVTHIIEWLSIASLVYLAAINGVATGCNMALAEMKKEKARSPKRIAAVQDEPASSTPTRRSARPRRKSGPRLTVVDIVDAAAQ